MSRWGRLQAGKPQENPHLPPLRTGEADTPQDDPEEKARILATKFFPKTGQADLSDITSDQQGTLL